MVVQEYEKIDLPDDSEEEKKITSTEARAKQHSLEAKSRWVLSRRDYRKTQSDAVFSSTDVSSASRHFADSLVTSKAIGAHNARCLVA